MSGLRIGDVVRYVPQSSWCHDGTAVAEQRDAGIVLVDTYWLSSPVVVRPESYEVLFNLNDFETRPRYEWETFAPADRQVVWQEHGYRPLFLVRKGATPDLTTQIENARERVSEAEGKVRSAQWGLDFARRELADLEAQAATS